MTDGWLYKWPAVSRVNCSFMRSNGVTVFYTMEWRTCTCSSTTKKADPMPFRSARNCQQASLRCFQDVIRQAVGRASCAMLTRVLARYAIGFPIFPSVIIIYLQGDHAFVPPPAPIETLTIVTEEAWTSTVDAAIVKSLPESEVNRQKWVCSCGLIICKLTLLY